MNDYGFIKLASVSNAVEVANPQQNAAEIAALIANAQKNGVKILITPELSLSGASCGDLFLQPALQNACLNALSSLLESTATLDMAIVLGLPLRVGSVLCNTSVVIKNGEILGAVPETHLTTGEKRYFAVPEETKTIQLLGHSVPFGKLLFDFGGTATMELVIGAAAHAEGNAAIIANPCAPIQLAGSTQQRKNSVAARSKDSAAAYVLAASSALESTTDHVYSGATIIAQNGELLACGETMALRSVQSTAIVDTAAAAFAKQKNGSFSQVQQFTVVSPFKSNDLTSFDQPINPHPFLPSESALLADYCNEVLAIQAHALARRLKHIGCQKCILGVSGGLDSTLALIVAKSALALLELSSKNVIGVAMPGLGTSNKTHTNAAKLMNELGVTTLEINISDACMQHFKSIEHDSTVHDITFENTQARERTQILMDLANKHHALLVGTGDLSEIALGWCTYGGDHMSMYNVNASVPKTLMRAMLKEFAASADNGLKELLLDIVATPISPELLPPSADGEISQKTQDKIGPYELHDFFLYHMLHSGAQKDKILFLAKHAFKGKYTAEQIKYWLEMFINRFFASQFKRSCSPDGVQATEISLSPRGAFAMPSDAKPDAWL